MGELAKFIQTYNSKIEFNPDRLEQIRDRLGKLALVRQLCVHDGVLFSRKAAMPSLASAVALSSSR